LSLFALSWAFGSLRYVYTQFMRDDSSGDQSHQRQGKDEHIPWNDNEKRSFKEYFNNLQIILEKICNNLSNIINNFDVNAIREFNGK
jgi:hypothetical protein